MKTQSMWTFCRIAVLIMTVLVFTPLVTPAGKSAPFFMGMPYALWVGIVVTLILLLLTIVGSLVHPGREE